MKYKSPSIRATAFNCPHCDALAKQHWYLCLAQEISRNKPPNIIDSTKLEGLKEDSFEDRRNFDRFHAWAKQCVTGEPFFSQELNNIHANELYNVWFSRCFNCNAISVWIYDNLIYPRETEVPPPNPYLPKDIKKDYLEAGSILDMSPRGAAALIRLAIQKLCQEILEQSSGNLNRDIKTLVAQGLDSDLQKAFDYVRVIGNNAIHPGQLDLSDDKATAENLLKLLNLIAEKMISWPKQVEELYSTLPEKALKAIENRDGKDDD